MDILGIGPLELFFILLIALIVLGPNDIVKTGRSIGRFLRKLVTSPNWRTLQDASREIRNLPNRLMREAGVEEIKDELQPEKVKKDLGLDEIKGEAEELKHDISAWTTPPEAYGTITPPAHPPKADPLTPSGDASEAIPPEKANP